MGDIVNGTYDGSDLSATAVEVSLRRYAELITPWAESVAAKMFDGVARQEATQWRQVSEEISAGLRFQMENTSIGQVERNIVEENIKLMKSLPLQAADRVMEIQSKAIGAMIAGGRSKALADEIYRSGDVAKSRARLIARTEIGRATQALTQARATAVGSEGYIWRTAHDGDVRHSHAKMEGKFVRWENPPTLDGMTGHAGALPNCRCYCEVVIPEK